MAQKFDAKDRKEGTDYQIACMKKQDYTLYSGAIWQSVPSLLSLGVFTKSAIVYFDEFRKSEVPFRSSRMRQHL